MVEQMWRVVYVDRTVSNRERHVMWRIADLLHVPQGAYVYTGATRCGVGRFINAAMAESDGSRTHPPRFETRSSPVLKTGRSTGNDRLPWLRR